MNEFLLKFIFILVMYLNFILNIKKPLLSNIVNLILLVCYFIISKETLKEKIIIVLTLLLFCIFTIVGELIIIQTSQLEYKNKDIFGASSWLFVSYSLMTMGILLCYTFLQKYLNI